MNEIPRWAKGSLKPEDAEKIKEAVRAAEKVCGAEFVPVIVRRSSGVGHTAIGVSLLLLLALYYARLYIIPVDPTTWQPFYYSLGEALCAGLLGWLISKSFHIQRLFTPRHDREQAVDRRARLEFYKHHVENTKSGNGVLLFISLFERKAAVLCGKNLAAKIPEAAWHEVSQLMTRGAKNGGLGLGMASAVEKSGELVRKHLPKMKKFKNELEDRLIVKE